MLTSRLSCGARIALLAIVVVCSVSERARASERSPPTLNPKDYAAPSGKYSLFVNPSDLYGRGGASYRLTLNGKEVWSAEKPYTLWEARVADDGVVAGYAYSHGWRGFSKAGYKAGPGEFRVVILDPQGGKRLDQVTKREDSHYFHIPPNPLATGLIMDPANDRVIFRVDDADINRQAESWSVYRLSTGQALAKFRPKELMTDPEPARIVIAAKPVAGTPLTLLHWWRYHWEKEQTRGARFTLIDQVGKAVWSMDSPADYEVAGDEDAEERLAESIHRKGCILATDQPGRFELRIVREAQRVTFRVSLAANGAWSVAEVGRRPFVDAAPASKPAEIPLLPLRQVGRIALKTPADGPVPEIRDVTDFEFDDRGRIAFLRRSEDKTLPLVVVDQQGKLLHAMPLDAAHAENRAGWSDFAWIGGDRYLLIRDDLKDPNFMEAARADVGSGKATPVAGFRTTVFSKLAGFRDGGFVVKGGLAKFTSDNSLTAFNADGTRLWSLPGNGDSRDPAALFSPNDLTVTTEGMIAVVDVIQKTVQFFDRAGKHHHTVDLEKAWGREPRYPAHLSADRDGGVVVEDFQGDPPIVRMKADGTVRAQVRPRLKDGRTFGLHAARVAPDGALWVSDGHALYRLADLGEVDRILGEGPDSRKLNQADDVVLDTKGQIYAVAGRTGTVHVFDPAGRWLRACVPDKNDVPEELTLPHLTVSDAGDVYLGMKATGDSRYLHFSPRGERVGFESSKLDDIGEEWYAQPGTGRRWVLGYEKIYLVDGDAVRTIMRRADGRWLERPSTAAVAADGSIAVVSSGPLNLSEDDGPIAVSLYSSRGEPIRTFLLPSSVAWSFPRIAYNGKLVVVAGEKEIVVFDVMGKPLGRFIPPGEGGDWWTPFLQPEDHELLIFDGRSSLYRFALP